VASSLPIAQAALARAAVLPPCALQAVGRDFQRVFADATPFQLGVAHGQSLHAKAIPETPIFEAEATALSFALDVSGLTHVTLVTDNRGLYFAVRKGRSSNFVANGIIQRILGLRVRGAVIGIDWVPTDKNPADIPSRVILGSGESHGMILH